MTETSSQVRLTLQFSYPVEDAAVDAIIGAALLAVADANYVRGHLNIPGSRVHERHVDLDENSGERVLR